MMNEKEICFDMDGTIADLYGVENWLADLINENTRPYEIARPLINMNLLARRLNKLQKMGYTLRIISWTSKNGTAEYDEAVATAKKTWLAKHLASVRFDEIAVLPYGTPKQEHGCGHLFDDEQKNRENWNGAAHDEKAILETLKGLIVNG